MSTETTEFAKNSFNLIRIYAALQVFLNHALAHLNIDVSPYINSIIAMYKGVPIFFILSGFLIWKSLDKTPTFKIFLKKRVLRLYPELWGSVIFNAVVVAILFNGRIVWKDFIAFQIGQSTVLQFWTPKSLEQYGFGSPNGALWTIPVMLQAYIVLYVFKKLINNYTNKYTKKSIWGGVLSASILFNIATPKIIDILPHSLGVVYQQTFIPYIWLFVLGAFYTEYFEFVVAHLTKIWFIPLGIAGLASLTGYDIGLYGTINAVFLSMAIVGIGYRFKRDFVKYDITYAFYLYHMVFINILIQLGITGHIRCVVYAFLLTLATSIISYIVLGRAKFSNWRLSK